MQTRHQPSSPHSSRSSALPSPLTQAALAPPTERGEAHLSQWLRGFCPVCPSQTPQESDSLASGFQSPWWGCGATWTIFLSQPPCQSVAHLRLCGWEGSAWPWGQNPIELETQTLFSGSPYSRFFPRLSLSAPSCLIPQLRFFSLP